MERMASKGPQRTRNSLRESVREAMAELRAEEQKLDGLAGKYFFAAEANELVEQLRERCSALERGLKAVQGNCKWREAQLCDLDCPGRSFCDVTGLNAMYLRREDESCVG